ncbi:hypothetical protein Bhyg_06369, partial [Pseudolycoriella hygida]
MLLMLFDPKWPDWKRSA